MRRRPLPGLSPRDAEVATHVTALASWFAHHWSATTTTALAAIAAVMLVQRVSMRIGMWPYALLALPGTFAHELAHYLVALALRAQPRFPRLLPERVGHGWRLGSVSFIAPWWRAMPIAIAPIALLPLSLWWANAIVSNATGAIFWLHAWIAASLASASLPSRADMRLALPAFAMLAAVAMMGGAYAALDLPRG